MSDWTDVKRWATDKAAGPYDYGIGHRVLALIAENDSQLEDLQNLRTDNAQLIYALKQEEQSYLVLRAERYQLKAENERLQKLISWQGEGNNKVEVNAGPLMKHMDERDQLRAEVAGLRTGYEACERVNAELKAEVARSTEREILQLAEIEALRKDAERYRWLREYNNPESEAPFICQQRLMFGKLYYAGPLVAGALDREVDSAIGKVEQS